jgi:hypothetical protein
MHLIIDPTKKQGEGLNGFVDIFIGSPQRKDIGIVVKLKNVKLEDLWRARQKNPKAKPKSQKDYNDLLTELRNADENTLLNLPYETKNNIKSEVKCKLTKAQDQLDRYMGIISCGEGGLAKGILDPRVSCTDGQGVLYGYVIIAVGGKRVICRSTKSTSTRYAYEIRSP